MAILSKKMVQMVERLDNEESIPLLEAHLGTLSALMARNIVLIKHPTRRDPHYYVKLTDIGEEIAPNVRRLLNGPSYWDTIHDLSPRKKAERKFK